MTTGSSQSDEVAQAPASTAPSLPSGAAEPLLSAVETATAPTVETGPVRTTVPFAGHHTGFAGFVHQYVREYIQLADQKAAFVFAASAALLAFLYNSGASKLWLKAPTNWAWIDAVAFLSMVGLAVTSFLAVITVFPRMGGAKRGLVFFNAIAAHAEPGDYVAAVGALNHSDIAAVQLQHCHELARVCRMKYRALRRSFFVGAVAMLATLMYLLFG